MAKRITQKTFDDVVCENMQEFDMSAEEALQEAEQQFLAQGIDLSNIVKDISSHTGEGTTHPVVAAVQNLSGVLDSGDIDPTTVKAALAQIKTECDIDLPHRCLAGSNKAYPVLFKLCQKLSSDKELLKCCVDALSSLLNGQPDLVDQTGIEYFTNLLKDSEESEELCEALVRMIRLTCVMHEKNRQAYVEQNLISVLISVLTAHQKSAGIVKEVCFALRVLTFDDDPRVPFGKAHEHAKMIVAEANALKVILETCNGFTGDVAVLGELFATLSKLAVRNEFCQEIADRGGLQLLMTTLTENMHHQGLAKHSIGLMRTIAGNDNVKAAIVNAGGVELIVGAMGTHQAQPQICENGCAALGTLALRLPPHCAKIVKCGGHEVIIQGMKIHKDVSAVQKQACMALRNLVARTREYCDPILELGAEGLINLAYQQHKDCTDEAKSALRDLGCKVDLIERWKGERGEISQ
ncbi:armadillo repeat-containing protein 6 [Lingula anatina]|uniref:Armadillo repeat-containing protein 6 n=1 Tax=Lingula anatina TaxID=7574 RepID=A0A1S3H4X2_LINAN|nr:armadillo repeat-containing protein 6 [Lingula anatina]|eukprot:XP_013381017.1 armadillo repeat-containing protein 6 [Lingula anatina]